MNNAIIRSLFINLNNIVDVTQKSFSISYELYFLNRFSGIINIDSVLYFEIPILNQGEDERWILACDTLASSTSIKASSTGYITDTAYIFEDTGDPGEYNVRESSTIYINRKNVNLRNDGENILVFKLNNENNIVESALLSSKLNESLKDNYIELEPFIVLDGSFAGEIENTKSYIIKNIASVYLDCGVSEANKITLDQDSNNQASNYCLPTTSFKFTIGGKTSNNFSYRILNNDNNEQWSTIISNSSSTPFNNIVEETCAQIIYQKNNKIVWASNIINIMTSQSQSKILSFQGCRYYTTETFNGSINVMADDSKYIMLSARILMMPTKNDKSATLTFYQSNTDNSVTVSDEGMEIDNTSTKFAIFTREFSSAGIIILTIKVLSYEFTDIETDEIKYIPIDDEEGSYFTLSYSIEDTNIIKTIYIPRSSEIPYLFNVEPYGISAGMLSTGTPKNKKFEIAENYTSYFYGKTNIFPIGSIYLSVTDVNPGNYFVGTWIKWPGAQGRVLVGVNEDDTEKVYQEPGQTGGERRVTLTKNQMPKHRHKPHNAQMKVGNKMYDWKFANIVDRKCGKTFRRIPIKKDSSGTFYTHGAYNYQYLHTLSQTGSEGGSQSHENMPPFITCYIWLRID